MDLETELFAPRPPRDFPHGHLLVEDTDGKHAVMCLLCKKRWRLWPRGSVCPGWKRLMKAQPNT